MGCCISNPEPELFSPPIGICESIPVVSTKGDGDNDVSIFPDEWDDNYRDDERWGYPTYSNQEYPAYVFIVASTEGTILPNNIPSKKHPCCGEIQQRRLSREGESSPKWFPVSFSSRDLDSVKFIPRDIYGSYNDYNCYYRTRRFSRHLFQDGDIITICLERKKEFTGGYTYDKKYIEFRFSPDLIASNGWILISPETIPEWETLEESKNREVKIEILEIEVRKIKE